MRVSTCLSALAVCTLCCSSLLNAADISWGPVTPISADTLNTNGVVAAAINVNSAEADPAIEDIVVGGITFTSDQLTFPSATGQGTFFTGDGGTTGDANLDTILDSHGWAGETTSIPIPDLTIGERYQVQLIGAGDTRECCGTRTQQGGDEGGNLSGEMLRNGGDSVIGTFVADSETQIVNVVPGVTNGVDPGLSAALVNVIGGPHTISINFGADEPGGARSDVTGAAGVIGTANWNNLDTLTGSASGLVDSDGLPTAASVAWTSNNTWASQGRGEENNTAPEGNDRNLMTGYLDTDGENANSVEVTGLSFDEPYNVVVYTKGGVVGRGGEYSIGDQTLTHSDTAAFDGSYKFGAEGDVLVFEGVTGDSFTLNGLPTIGDPPRAPINGIEITSQVVPEPSSMVLLGLGLLSLLGVRRRR